MGIESRVHGTKHHWKPRLSPQVVDLHVEHAELCAIAAPLLAQLHAVRREGDQLHAPDRSRLHASVAVDQGQREALPPDCDVEAVVQALQLRKGSKAKPMHPGGGVEETGHVKGTDIRDRKHPRATLRPDFREERLPSAQHAAGVEGVLQLSLEHPSRVEGAQKKDRRWTRLLSLLATEELDLLLAGP
eukprot:scaffold8593_cov248-Pinguiococcus_pyrenoidosus.AAC.4